MRRDAKKILMLSHQITGVTGFASVTRRVAMAFDKAGYDVYAIGQNYKGFPIRPRELGNVTMLPIGNDMWGQDIVPFYFDMIKPDIFWTLTDIWACHYIHNLPKKWPWNWVRHVTLDTENIVPFWADSIKQTDVPIAFSKMGKRLMEAAGIDWGAYIQHGVDTKVFKPASEKEKAQLRSKIEIMDVLQNGSAQQKSKGIPQNAFVVFCVAHNQFRKNLDVLIRAFALFSANKPDAMLILHTQPKDGLGWDIPQLLRKYNLQGKVFFTSMNAKMVADIWVTEKMMRDLYVISDVHALLTGGEGFGIPIVEAMACGIPNICTMWTTPREFLADERVEIVEHEGKKVKQHRLDMNRGLLVPIDHVLDHHTGGEWGVANEREAAGALELLYSKPEMRKAMGKKARSFAVRNYDWGKVLPKWIELVENINKYAKTLEPEPVEVRLMDIK